MKYGDGINLGVWCNGSTGDSGPPSNCSNQLAPTFKCNLTFFNLKDFLL